MLGELCSAASGQSVAHTGARAPHGRERLGADPLGRLEPLDGHRVRPVVPRALGDEHGRHAWDLP